MEQISGRQRLDTFFLKDADLIDYVQRMVGLSAIGKVYVEALIIAYGEGRNGKSTFWNVIARVLGTYSGNISADMLTVGCRRNVKSELAEAKGKRMLIAAELEEGMRLNTANVSDSVLQMKSMLRRSIKIRSHILRHIHLCFILTTCQRSVRLIKVLGEDLLLFHLMPRLKEVLISRTMQIICLKRRAEQSLHG